MFETMFAISQNPNPNQPVEMGWGVGGVKIRTPWYILLYNILVTDLNIMEFGDFSLKLFGIKILTFSAKVELVFAMSALFHEHVLFFVYLICWNN